MPDKRKASTEAPSPKRARVSYGENDSRSYTTTSHEKPRNNPLYGQKNAFPGIDDADGEISYYDTDDGLQYLRMVRSEANALPSLLAAPSSKPQNTDINPETGERKAQVHSFPPGFDDDEACIAPANRVSNAEPIYPEAQSHYHNLLRHRFLLLRSTLKCSPPANAIASLDDSHPISLPRLENARKEWRRLVLSVDPQMVQLACMDLESVLAVLKITARMMSEVIRNENAMQIRRMSAWAWGLLGKCRELGQLGTEEVGGIRDIGKRAVTILKRMREEAERQATANSYVEDGAQWDEVSEADSGEDQGSELEETRIQPEENIMDEHDSRMSDDMSAAELEAAKAKLQAKLLSVDSDIPAGDESSLAQCQTQALLDMIITVVGEFYGQRDLLEAREIWTD